VSDRSEPAGTSRRNVLKSGAIGLGALAGVAGVSGWHAANADAAPAAAAQLPAGTDNYFLKLDGIAGESADAKHKGEIQLLSFSWGASAPTTGSGASGSGAGKVTFQDFNFTSRTSKASPLLMVNTATGKHIDNALITVSRRSRGGGQDYIKIELTDVLVSSYEQSASNGTTPVDAASLSYAKIQFSYLSQAADGSAGGTTTGGWDIKQHKAI
jgi:type VI secretion system secreted protein Hcp